MIAHCRVTLFTVDTDRRISMLEGALIRDATDQDGSEFENMGRPDWYIGENVYEVFSRLGAGGQLDFLEPIDDVFAGKTAKDSREDTISTRRFLCPPCQHGCC